jgi:hypothetical protein
MTLMVLHGTMYQREGIVKPIRLLATWEGFVFRGGVW